MRIGIDARFLTHPQAGGFKTYTCSLVAALSAVDRENEYVLYVDRIPGPEEPLSFGPNFAVRAVPGSLPLLGMLWREQVALSRQAARDQLDVFHAPNLTAPLRRTCPSVVTIHDMIWYRPEKYARNGTSSRKRSLMRWYYRRMPRLAARRAAAIITVSRASKESILEHLGLPEDRIFVTHEAASPLYRRIENAEALAAVRRKYGLAPQFILAIGSADPRKNIAALVQAYGSLPASLQERYPLTIVWTHRHLASEIAQQAGALGIASRLRFLERVPDGDLVLLYNAASVFVFPSHEEGFGLPLLEAMACGTPVVAADNSSIPEIVGPAALLVDSTDAPALAGAITRVLEDEALRARMVCDGLSQAGRFSWTRCARETVAVYQQALTWAGG